MKIEKKKVTDNAKLSAVEKGAIASVLGIAATFSLTACTPGAESGDVMGPVDNPESSNDSQVQPSSSSQIDIPKSNEALSSSAIEALSSVAGPLSSSSVAATSSEAAPTSSATSSSDSVSSSSDAAPNSSSVSSSSNTAPSSSSIDSRIEIVPQSSSVDIKNLVPVPIDSINLILCPDSTHSCLITSMVTTFEHDDLQA